MGNRAVITGTDKRTAIYLHWNGGRDSVEGFLEYARLKGVRSPKTDPPYALARLTQIIGNFLGGTLSLGIVPYEEMYADNGDNGAYIVGDDWKIVGREFFDGKEQCEYSLADALEAIDKAQPEKERLGEDFLTAEVVPVSALEIGDTVTFVEEFSDGVQTARVIGRGEVRLVNGQSVYDVPYTDRYGDKPEENINNYLLDQTARRVVKKADAQTPEPPAVSDENTAQ